MKLLTYFFILNFTILANTHGNSQTQRYQSLESFYNPRWKMTKRSLDYMQKKEVMVKSDVNSKSDRQNFKMQVAAIHNKKCSKVLRKLSLFSNYEKWIGFINSSKYDEKNRLLTIKANHALLPFPMIVHVILDRPTKPGVYPFTFPTGLFTGLKGEFTIAEVEKKCVFYSRSNWSGKKKIPDFAIELFSEGLTKIGAETLFRKLK